MSISSETSKVVYTGDDSTSIFPYTFRILADTEIKVTKVLIASPYTETELTLTTDYTVSDVGEDAGGDITLVAGALASTHKLVLQRNMPLTQTTDYVENDPFPAETHEEGLDRLVMIAQQIQEAVDRSIKQAITETGTNITLPVAEASKIIGWNATADDLINYDNPDDAVTAAEAAQAAAEAAQAAAESAQSAAASSASAAASSATASANSATAAAASAAEAAASVAAANLPSSLTGQATNFLQVNAGETGYDLISQIDLAAEVTGLLPHENGGIEADISAIAKGDVLAGSAAGVIGIIAASGASDGDVLTLQADGTLAYETPSASGYTQIAWVKFNGTGTPAPIDSYNVTSITDNGAGDYTINLSITFGNGDYCVVGSCNNGRVLIDNQATTTITYHAYDTANPPIKADPARAYCIAIGD